MYKTLLFVLLIFFGSLHAEEVLPKSTIAIANWDFVPHQVISKKINIGVVAFHVSGIEKVEFYVDDQLVSTASSPQYNNDSQVTEYFFTLDPQKYEDKKLSLSARAYPVSGNVKVLPVIEVFANAADAYTKKEIYVALSGSDQNGDGSSKAPLASIANALKKIDVGGTIILAEPGTYFLSGEINKKLNDYWTTISSAPALNRNEVTLTMQSRAMVRLKMDKIKFKRVSIDFSKVSTFYPENGQSLWFDDCRWFDSSFKESPSDGEAPLNYKFRLGPVRSSAYIKGYYVTNSIAQKTFEGFIGARLARNVKIDRVVGDALTNAKLIINAEITNILGNETEVHSDAMQFYGYDIDNLIVYNVLGKNLGGIGYRANLKKISDNGVQNFFVGDSNTTVRNSAFVNACIVNMQAKGSAPFSQLNSVQSNVLYENITTINQNWLLRSDLPGTKKFVPENVVFKNCHFPNLVWKRDKDDARTSNSTMHRRLPDGITLINTSTKSLGDMPSNFCDNALMQGSTPPINKD